MLALGVVEHNFEYNGKPNKAAAHDLVAASAERDAKPRERKPLDDIIIAGSL